MMNDQREEQRNDEEGYVDLETTSDAIIRSKRNSERIDKLFAEIQRLKNRLKDIGDDA